MLSLIVGLTESIYFDYPNLNRITKILVYIRNHGFADLCVVKRVIIDFQQFLKEQIQKKHYCLAGRFAI